MRQRRIRKTVLTQDLGRDALSQSISVLRVQQQCAIRVGVGVDEPRRDGQAGRVDGPGRARLRQFANGGYLAVCDPDIGGNARSSSAVDNGTAYDKHIEHVLPPASLCVISATVILHHKQVAWVANEKGESQTRPYTPPPLRHVSEVDEMEVNGACLVSVCV